LYNARQQDAVKDDREISCQDLALTYRAGVDDIDRYSFTLLGRWLPWALSGLMVERWLGSIPVEVQFLGSTKTLKTRSIRVTRWRELILLELPISGVRALGISVLYGWLPLRLLVMLARFAATERFVTLYDGCPYRGLRIDGRWLLCVGEVPMRVRLNGAILPVLPENADQPFAVAMRGAVEAAPQTDEAYADAAVSDTEASPRIRPVAVGV
jgi:hypothetical protein